MVGYSRVLKAGFRTGDDAPMAVIELVDRNVEAKKIDKPKKVEDKENKTPLTTKEQIKTPTKKQVNKVFYMQDIFKVKKNYDKCRFDRWFKQEVKNLPNSLIQKLIRKNQIKVNNKRIKSSFRLSEGDNVKIFSLQKYKSTNFKTKINYLPTRKEKTI